MKIRPGDRVLNKNTGEIFILANISNPNSKCRRHTKYNLITDDEVWYFNWTVPEDYKYVYVHSLTHKEFKKNYIVNSVTKVLYAAKDR